MYDSPESNRFAATRAGSLDRTNKDNLLDDTTKEKGQLYFYFFILLLKLVLLAYTTTQNSIQ